MESLIPTFNTIFLLQNNLCEFTANMPNKILFFTKKPVLNSIFKDSLHTNTKEL